MFFSHTKSASATSYQPDNSIFIFITNQHRPKSSQPTPTYACMPTCSLIIAVFERIDLNQVTRPDTNAWNARSNGVLRAYGVRYPGPRTYGVRVPWRVSVSATRTYAYVFTNEYGWRSLTGQHIMARSDAAAAALGSKTMRQCSSS